MFESTCLRRVRGLLADHSILCVEMPEWGGPEELCQLAGFRHVKPLEHLALYSEGAAIELFLRTGLAVVALAAPG